MSSRFRARSSRFTLLSSTTSNRAPPWLPSRTLELHQRFRDARVFDLQRVERHATGSAYRREASKLDLLGHGGEVRRAERIAIRLEGMRGTPETLRIAGCKRAAHVFHHHRRLDEKGIDEILHKLGAGCRLEILEYRAIDGFGHVSGSLVPGRGSAPRPGARRGSAWSCNRPCPPRDTSRGRLAWRWQSWRRCAAARADPSASRSRVRRRGHPSRASARPSTPHRKPAAAPILPLPGRSRRRRPGSPFAEGSATPASDSRRCPRPTGCAADDASRAADRYETAHAPPVRPAKLLPARAARPGCRKVATGGAAW